MEKHSWKEKKGANCNCERCWMVAGGECHVRPSIDSNWSAIYHNFSLLNKIYIETHIFGKSPSSRSFYPNQNRKKRWKKKKTNGRHANIFEAIKSISHLWAQHTRSLHMKVYVRFLRFSMFICAHLIFFFFLLFVALLFFAWLKEPISLWHTNHNTLYTFTSWHLLHSSLVRSAYFSFLFFFAACEPLSV